MLGLLYNCRRIPPPPKEILPSLEEVFSPIQNGTILGLFVIRWGGGGALVVRGRELQITLSCKPTQLLKDSGTFLAGSL